MNLYGKHRPIARCLVLAVIAASLVGCGGSLSPNSGDTPRVLSGAVALPAGTSIALSGLRLVTCGSQSPVSSAGAFRAQQTGSGLAIVYAVDSQDRPILCGFADAGSATSATIDVTSTAVALLFNALGGYTLPRESWSQALALIAANSQTTALAQVVAQRMAANPAALGEGDQALLDAVWAAAQQIVPAGTGLNSKSKSGGLEQARAVTSMRVAVTRGRADGDAPVTYTLQPTDPQSGVSVAINPRGAGILITNNYRRHISYFIYRTGYDDAQGQFQGLDTWEYHKPASLTDPGYVSATTGLSGIIGSLIDTAGGNVPYSPTTGAPEVLPLSPPDAQKTYYRIVVVGPSLKLSNFEDELPADLVAQPQKAAWENTCNAMGALTFFQEIFAPMILTFVPLENLGQNIGPVKSGELAKEVIAIVTQSAPSFAEYLDMRNYKQAAVTAAKMIATNTALRVAVFQALVEYGLLKGAPLAIAQAVGEKIAGLYLTIVDKLLAGADLGAVMAHLTSSTSTVEWTATGVKPTVRISPNPGSVMPSSSVSLTCLGVAGVPGTKEYLWETPGLHGSLADSHGNTGKSFTSSDPTVTYTANVGTDGDTENVTVKVNIRNGNQRTLIGTGAGVVNIASDPYQPSGSTPALMTEFVLGPVPDGAGWKMTAYAYIAWKGPQDLQMYISTRGQTDANGNPFSIGSASNTWTEKWGSPVVIGPAGSPTGPGTVWARTFGGYDYICWMPGYHGCESSTDTPGDAGRQEVMWMFNNLYASVHADNVPVLGCSVYTK